MNDEQEDAQFECVCREIITELIARPYYPKGKITELKNKILKKYSLTRTMKNSEILQYASEEELEIILPILRRRSTRTISGVTVVAVMTKPIECPGKCLYCPGSDSQPGEKAAQSYTGQEPAAIRSIIYGYDPYLQTRNRLLDLQSIGHKIDKIELILMGGTLLSAPETYQRNFVKGCYDAINHFYESEPSITSQSLEESLKRAETAQLRVVGLTVETRPDYCFPPHIDKILSYGGTRVEIGIQTTRSTILAQLNRGHTIQDSKHAIRYAKDVGLKINTHIMPNLPGTTPKEDFEDFMELFRNPDFRPDMLKIYPTLVVKGTKLYEMWKKGEYQSYSLETTVNLIAKMKSHLPKYVRIQRIQRDIPAYLIEDGVKKSNLRQLVQNRLKELNQQCSCIRCREQGFVKQSHLDNDTFELERVDYEASEGLEIFLSYEQNNTILGYLRLRKPSEQVHRSELRDDTMIIREIRVVGEIVPRLEKPFLNQVQHRGYGQKLLMKAEEIARDEFESKKLAIISGVGVREYFYKLGYQRDGAYVSRLL
ncbi:MAG: tRNA uridine(34) 5-carboxymethylaminomethyl modification radical SAM/GNAT enzyme Elp3 [Candidatus Lokiarchaeota archaeon]|nr:tRNA uridine(34) 5-carboxymethylaminomethyl modification radical SAM/GNAT enzyme Elp3 [Candidatus Lokiarchaeota archaeon]